MADIWTLTIPAIVGAAAWLYQKAWDRVEKRAHHYEDIMDALSGFLEGSRDPQKINAAIATIRKLWIYAPDAVVTASNTFLNSVEAGGGPEAAQKALGELALAMRRDASISAALLPRRPTRLKPADFQLKSARVL